MVPVELRPLLSRLDASCTSALEAAAGVCVSRAQYEVTVEHLLLKLLDDPAADLAPVLARYEVDVGRLRRSLEQELGDLRTGNAGKPVFSPLLIELIEDAWLLASIDFGLPVVRSGVLLLAMAARPRRFLQGDLPELEKVPFQDLHRSFKDVVSTSGEERQVARAAAAVTSPSDAARPSAPAQSGALARFATDLTAAAREGKIDPVFGRDREIRQIVDILSRRRKNNPIVVGEAGVGKTAVVEGFALRIAQKDVPPTLTDVDVWALDLGRLQAGAGVKGEFEARLKAVIEEVASSSRPVILFIDEAHTLIGAGAAPGASDAANMLKPALARGELRTIAATTWAEYKKDFEEDAALARRFQPVTVDEPSVEDAALMLRGLKARYEVAHGVVVRDDAVEAAARLSARYVTGRLLPDKAVDLLDTAAARVKIGSGTKPGRVEDLERSIAALDREREGVLRDKRGGLQVDAERLADLDAAIAARRASLDELTRRWKAQGEAVERVRALRTASPVAGDAASPELQQALAELRRAQGEEPLVRLEVDPEVVAQVVADWTGVPAGRMVQGEAAQVMQLEATLRERIKGQDHALEIVGRALRGARVGLKDPGKPQVFLLAGPSGVGKTELGLTVADALFGGERFAVSINMSEYQDREMGVSGLIGAKPGYVGYGKGGTLTEAVRQRPYCVVLLDEIEKACTEARNLFYQVFDKGELVDGTGRRVDFKNTVIFMTTNLAADVIQGMCEAGAPDVEAVLGAIRPLLSAALQPAWLARTTIVPFFSLQAGPLEEIARIKVRRIAQRIREAHRIELEVAGEVTATLAARCSEVETGARNIDFLLQSSLMPLVSNEILARLAEGASPRRMGVGVDGQGRFSVWSAR